MARWIEAIAIGAAVVGCSSILGLKDGTAPPSCKHEPDCPSGERCVGELVSGNAGIENRSFICYPVARCTSFDDCSHIGDLDCAPDNTCRTRCGVQLHGVSIGCTEDETCVVPGGCPSPPCTNGLCYGKNEIDGGCTGGGCPSDGGANDGSEAGTPPATYPAPRGGVAAVATSNGIVYAMGGSGPGSVATNDVYAYDVRANTWTKKASMTHARTAHGAAVARNQQGVEIIVVAGGYDTNGNAVGPIDIYSPVTDSWAAGPDMPTPRGELGVAFGAPGRVYAAGGRITRNGAYMATVDVFDASMSRWESPAPPLMNAAAGPALVSFPMATPRTYAIGGAAGLPLGVDGTQVVSRDGTAPQNAWAVTPSLGIGRISPCAAMSGTTILVAGGFGGTPIAALPTAETFVEMTPPPSWKSVPPMKTARAGCGMAAVTDNSNVLYVVVAGYDSGMQPMTSVEIFDSKANAWR